MINKAVRVLIMQMLADMAMRSRRQTLTLKGIGFIGDSDTHTLIGINANLPADIVLQDVGSHGAQRAISIDEANEDRRRDVRSNVKVTVSGGSSVVGGRSGVSVTQGSNAELEIKENSTVTGGIYGVEERDAVVERLKADLPADTPPAAIQDALDAVQAVKGGTHEEMEAAVRGSRLWEWIKEYGPDVLGLVVKAGAALAGQG
ncbi:hypothetical protein [Burkholderia cenocepacia]|uniref:hypothetical protein n=1 Tax=Burkholderia cenocepacia TaxID=95486 RepID=UPI001F4AE22D|nr:hypothetical protein [Burkholderia cenocepacia]